MSCHQAIGRGYKTDVAGCNRWRIGSGLRPRSQLSDLTVSSPGNRCKPSNYEVYVSEIRTMDDPSP